MSTVHASTRSTQTLLLNAYARDVQTGLDRLHTQRFFQRLWDRDPGLWVADPARAQAIRNRLGWLRISQLMATRIASLRTFAEEIRQAGFTHALLLGMGGSGLFSEVCRKTFQDARGLELTVLDTTDPSAIRAAQARCSLSQLLTIVSSKSGTTSEVSALSRYFYEAFKHAGLDAGAHCIGITDAGTPLEAQAQQLQYRRLFIHGAQDGADVGGRFSALTYFGLVPAALIGADVDQLLRRAQAMFDQCQPTTTAQDNPAAQLGVALGVLATAGRDKFTLLCAPELASFGTWVEQLVAESTGKSGKGIAPFYGEPLLNPETYQADRVFVELQLASAIDSVLDRQVHALTAAGHPVIRIHWQDRYDLGAEVAKWAIATAVAGHVLGIDPFDEPNVKESKDRTKALLERYTNDHRLPEPTPSCYADDGVTAYRGAASGARAPSPHPGNPVRQGGEEREQRSSRSEKPMEPRPSGWGDPSLVQCLSEWIRQRHDGDYLAVLSFLPRTALLDQAVSGLREQAARQLEIPTALGFGPRYLHSTGQLYKGGPDAALFLLLTAEEPNDLSIPGEPFTFGVLKQAQALGDFEAMQQKGRRILHLHLRGNLEQSLQRVMHALSEATTLGTL